MVFVLLCMVCACGQDKGEADNSTASEVNRGVEENIQAKTKQEESELDEDAEKLHVETMRMGGISSEDALEYMKTTEELVIVEVNVPEWKMSTGFTGAMFIPYTEMNTRYDEIPKERPVLLHCGGGIVSVEAYEILLEKRPDIPWLGYIAGAPMVRDYNEWLASQK